MVRIRVPKRRAVEEAPQTQQNVNFKYTYGPHIPPIQQSKEDLKKSLWCITYYFNPCGFYTRYQLFLLFHQHLLHQTDNLFVIEVATSPEKLVLHQVHNEENLVQIVDDSLIWQKERLFNICIPILPPTCTKVVWLDGDILFDNDDWVVETSSLLDHYKVVQPYYQNARLPSTISSIDHGIDIETFYYGFGDEQRCDGDIHGMFKGKMGWNWWGHPGYAYGYQRELLETHGLYDRCIAGSSDTLISQAVLGKHKDSHLIHEHYNEACINHYLEWAESFHHDIGLSINFARETNVFHLYHGPTKQRAYLSRLRFLNEVGFDYGKDLDINTSNGCYKLAKEDKKILDWLDKYYNKRGDDQKELVCNL